MGKACLPLSLIPMKVRPGPVLAALSAHARWLVRTWCVRVPFLACTAGSHLSRSDGWLRARVCLPFLLCIVTLTQLRLLPVSCFPGCGEMVPMLSEVCRRFIWLFLPYLVICPKRCSSLRMGTQLLPTGQERQGQQGVSGCSLPSPPPALLCLTVHTANPHVVHEKCIRNLGFSDNP